MTTSHSLRQAIRQITADDRAFVASSNQALPKRAANLGGLEPFSGTWNITQARHLLRRCLFGFTEAQAKVFAGATLSEAVDSLLSFPTDPPTPPLNVNASESAIAIGETWVTAAYDSTLNFQRGVSLQSWWMGLLLNQEANLREKMTFFWHNHFACEIDAAGDARYMYNQNVLLRKSCLGNVKTLAKDISLDCAMLRYLNGNTNTAKSPNENYGRELLELFTIGKGPEISAGNYTHYTEDDVKAAARILTGFKDVRETMTSTFTDKNHDAGDKTFSSAFGNAVIKGLPGAEGASELDSLINLIFVQAETARQFCRKLYRYFVYYVIDAETEKNVIEPLAKLLRDGKYEIKPVLAALLKSAHFHHAANQGNMIKTPLDLIAGFAKQAAVQWPDRAAIAESYAIWRSMQDQSSQMQLELLDPPNVAGWPCYWQEPGYYQLWINSATLPTRLRFTDRFLSNQKWVSGVGTATLDVLALTETVSDPIDVVLLVSEMAGRFSSLSLTENQLTYLKDSLLDQLPDYEWGVDWERYTKDKTNAAARKAVETRLKTFFRALTAMAEYQLA